MSWLLGILLAGVIVWFAIFAYRNSDSAAARLRRTLMGVETERDDWRTKHDAQVATNATQASELAETRRLLADREVKYRDTSRKILRKLRGSPLLEHVSGLLEGAGSPGATDGDDDGRADPGDVPPALVDPWPADN